ncbi:MAG: dihydroorotate dehydrogenase electron transfer subunit [Coprobacter sp.]|nr:dihydroorotate dehydrogenase electron transfer subunit [Coprobacter sp.]
MKKYVLDLKVKANIHLHENYVLLKFTTSDGTPLPDMMPGQFVEIRIDDSPSTFLRRPISVNNVDRELNELWLLVQLVGAGTRKLAAVKPEDTVNMVLPLGNTFSIPENRQARMLLIGGGVGTAPMLYLGKTLWEKGYTPVFLLGARSEKDLLQLDEFRRFGEVYLTTEDGSVGEQGYVTQHSVLSRISFDYIYTCGPKPMMQAVAKYAGAHQIACEVSLENTMACGVGACLCCVENTVEGHVCVCKEGPIFNIDRLLWQI